MTVVQRQTPSSEQPRLTASSMKFCLPCCTYNGDPGRIARNMKTPACSHHAADAALPHRRGDRIELLATVHESGSGTNRTCGAGLTMSVHRGRPEVTGRRSK